MKKDGFVPTLDRSAPKLRRTSTDRAHFERVVPRPAGPWRSSLDVPPDGLHDDSANSDDLFLSGGLAFRYLRNSSSSSEGTYGIVEDVTGSWPSADLHEVAGVLEERRQRPLLFRPRAVAPRDLGSIVVLRTLDQFSSAPRTAARGSCRCSRSMRHQTLLTHPPVADSLNQCGDRNISQPKNDVRPTDEVDQQADFIGGTRESIQDEGTVDSVEQAFVEESIGLDGGEAVPSVDYRRPASTARSLTKDLLPDQLPTAAKRAWKCCFQAPAQCAFPYALLPDYKDHSLGLDHPRHRQRANVFWRLVAHSPHTGQSVKPSEVLCTLRRRSVDARSSVLTSGLRRSQMFLRDAELQRMLKEDPSLLEHLNCPDDLDAPESPIQPSSVDLTVGEIYVPFRKKWFGRVGAAKGRTDLVIESGETAVVLTGEVCNFPSDIGAIGFPPVKVSSKGLLMTNPGHVDPGFKGRMSFTVINMGREPFPLRKGDQIVTLLLYKMERDARRGWSDRNHAPKLEVNEDVLLRLSPDFLDVSRRARKAAAGAERVTRILGLGVPILVALLTAGGAIYLSQQSTRDQINDLKRQNDKLEQRLGQTELEKRVDELEARLEDQGAAETK